MCDIGDNMADRGIGGALSRENRDTFRDVYSTPELWQQMRSYGGGQSEEWPNFRLNPITGEAWKHENQMEFMEMMMEAFRRQEDERRLGGSVTEKTKTHIPDPDFPEGLPGQAGPGYIKEKK